MIIKLILFTFISFGFQNIIGQEFDPDFLASLPEEVRSDLLNQVTAREALEEEQFRRPSTFIEKPSIDSDRFGINIFSMMQTSLMPVNEPNFDSGYILDFGDQLQLQLVGQKSSFISLLINRDGSVNIPEVGKIFLSGLTLGEATNIIKKTIENSYIGVEAFVTLTNIRDIQIIVSGNVFNPGPYTLNGNSNIFHALSVSGGPSESGSFRQINLVRGSEVIETIDLYDTFIEGKPRFGTRLRSGDMVFVKPAGNLVGLYGGIKRPGLYELKDDETLKDLIYFGNGFSPDADLANIKMEEIKLGKVTKRLISSEKLSYESLNDGVNILIRRFPIKEVTINGAVKTPGTYKINEGDGILEAIQAAGGYTQDAYEFGGILINQQALEANMIAKDELYRAFINTLIQNSAYTQSASSASIGMLITELRESPVSGRISAEFDLQKIAKKPSLNTMLKNDDEIFIPEKVNHIYVFGEVSNQGTVTYAEEKGIDFYIQAKGGLSESADINNVYILHPNGASEKVKRKNLFRDGNSPSTIYPGSIIFVPRKLENIYLTESLQAYAVILGNLGVSLASLAVIKD